VSGLAISQCINDFTKSSQTGIDFFGFIKCLTFSSSFAYFLAACQINQVKSSRFGTKIFKIILAYGNNEKEVGS
jgi:hypothetical protein